MNRPESNKVLKKLNSNLPALGGWVLTASPVVAELFAIAGFDWVCIDAEHSAVSKETAQNMITAIERHGAEPLVRVSGNIDDECKRFLDMGARGIIIPMIKSYEDVMLAVEHTKFPPLGKRSYSLSRSTMYGKEAGDHFTNANDNTLLGIMIEHIDPLNDLDKIFSEPTVDVILVGPYDLSGSMGIPGEFEKKEFKEAIELINRKAAENNVRMGIHEVHPTPEKVQKLIEEGFTFIACGIDSLFLTNEAEKYTRLLIKK
jgi:2-dehydro-3-deoxyglucarate aldolase